MTDLVATLVREAGVTLDDLRSIVANAPDRYKVYEIDKKTGGKREIAQPAREVKLLQYIIIDSVLSRLPIHEAATAYRTGLSILDNAKPHASTLPILKMDFKDFFPSILASDWISYCANEGLLSERDRVIAARIMFRRRKPERLLRLSIGAPSSPMLSNILMFRFDQIISQAADKRGIRYTRYADDLTFSGQRIGMLRDMVKEVKTETHRLPYPKLTINEDKTAFVSTAARRQVTGVVLANDGSVGIGRDRKRIISARVHKASMHLLSRDALRALAGELAFVNVVDAEFLTWLARKYGAAVINHIKRLDV